MRAGGYIVAFFFISSEVRLNFGLRHERGTSMDDCDLLLAGGVFKTDLLATSEELRTAWEQFWYSMSEEEARNTFDSGAKVPLPQSVNIVEGHLSDEDFRKWKQSVGGKYSGSTFARSDLLAISHHADPAIIDGFNRCIETTRGKMNAWAISVGTGEVLFYTRYDPEGDNPKKPVVSNSTVTNAYVPNNASVQKGQIFPKGKVLPFGIMPVSLTRENPEKPCTFVVNTSEGNPSYELKAVSAVPQPPAELILSVYDVTEQEGIQIGVIQAYGTDTMHNGPPYIDRANMAEWEIVSPANGNYMLKVTYASLESRPMRLLVNKTLVNANACGRVTGGWDPGSRQEESEGTVAIRRGLNKIRLESDHYCPHINRIRLELIKP